MNYSAPGGRRDVCCIDCIEDLKIVPGCCSRVKKIPFYSPAKVPLAGARKFIDIPSASLSKIALQSRGHPALSYQTVTFPPGELSDNRIPSYFRSVCFVRFGFGFSLLLLLLLPGRLPFMLNVSVRVPAADVDNIEHKQHRTMQCMLGE